MSNQTLAQPRTFAERAQKSGNSVGRELFTLMESKQTNLAVNPDVTLSRQFLEIADAVGPHICILKTHIDMLSDYTPKVITRLEELAAKHNFILFEDRKFGDIGSVAREQYRGGVYHIAKWAKITNAHPVPGPGVIESLAEEGRPFGNGLLLVAQMSSKGALAKGEYTKAATEMAKRYPEFVMGFICQERLSDDPGLLHITPGVQLQEGTDGQGQQYRTPEKAILEQGNDVVIVGRGVYQSEDPAATAQRYREAAWDAYKKRSEG